mmetsp:Transcript_4516/g.12751  ORF Transcript_4516/g.12751 Transcript_4516/m.12751 type:complete len:210 (-) Transcript_4516:981-1610(-)
MSRHWPNSGGRLGRGLFGGHHLLDPLLRSLLFWGPFHLVLILPGTSGIVDRLPGGRGVGIRDDCSHGRHGLVLPPAQHLLLIEPPFQRFLGPSRTPTEAWSHLLQSNIGVIGQRLSPQLLPESASRVQHDALALGCNHPIQILRLSSRQRLVQRERMVVALSVQPGCAVPIVITSIVIVSKVKVIALASIRVAGAIRGGHGRRGRHELV